MIIHNPAEMKKLALTGLDNDVRKTLMWAADELVRLNAIERTARSVLFEAEVNDLLRCFVKGVELLDYIADKDD